MSGATRPPAGVLSEPTPPLQLNLLRGFELRCADRPRDVPTNGQRLLAFLAVRGRAQHRHAVAGTLWGDSPEDRAAASLRTALWRVRRVDRRLVTTSGVYLSIGPEVVIDVTDATDQARRLADDPSALGPTTQPAQQFSVDDLLPEWYDDWVLLERERLRQVHLHSLEAIARHLSALGRHALAVEAGLAAVAAEPLRESAQQVLISAHMAEGNVFEAVRQFDTFAVQLHDALGIEPSASTRQLVAPCR